jgi:RNA polymerase sigma factor (sigma-70 family)
MTVAQEASGAALSPTVSRAAEELFHEHSGWLYGYCLRLLRSPEEAEDAVQATYLNACRSLGRGTRPRAGSAWLLHIARNVCFTRLRARRREGVERVGDVAVLEETVAAPNRSYDSLVGLTEALLSLPERQREAILLREWQGLSHGEIAERLEISHSAAETLIFRARRSLADALENPGKRSRFKALHALDLVALLGPLKGLLAGGAGLKAATAVTVAALTTVTVVATDPPSFFGQERAATATRSQPVAMAAAAVTHTAVVVPSATSVTAPRPYAADTPPPAEAERGRAHGEATADAAKDKPKNPNAAGANANGNANADGNGNGKALGTANQPVAAPGTSNGRGTPASGQPESPAQTAPPEEPAPPPNAKAIGLAKENPAKSK